MSIVLNPVRANIGSGLDLEVRLCAWLASQEMLGHAQSQATQTYALQSHVSKGRTCTPVLRRQYCCSQASQAGMCYLHQW